MILLVFIINFAISWANAWGCGKTWDSTRAKGGAAHFMNWMGAIMSASGFTWCYLVLVGLLASTIPAQWFAEEGQVVEGMLLDPASLQVFFELGYMVIILPILGSGLAITVATWRQFARARHRTAGDYAITGWNTFAQIHNTYSALREIPTIWEHLGTFFSGKSSDSDDSKGKLIIALVAIAVLGGILTTFGIIQSTRRSAVYEQMRQDLAG